MRPIVGTLAEELYASLAPFAYDDEAHDWAMLHHCQAAMLPVQWVADLVRDSDDGPGWSALVDPDRCPDFALPWLAQPAGVTLVPGMTADQQRALIRDEPAQDRGTLGALVAAAQRRLTGTKRVILRERDGSAYRLTVITLISETPDAAGTEADIRAVKPAGLVLNYETSADWSFEILRTTFDTFADVAAEYSDFEDLRTNHGTI